MPDSRRVDSVALVIGAVTALATDRLAARSGPRRRVALCAVALPGDAAIYPLARSSRIPDWYPAMCAGYDIALAGLLVR